MFWNEEAAARTAYVAYAVAHPVRVQILAALIEGPAYVMDLTAALGRRQANISQHLAVLREAGLVVSEREGMMVRYRLSSPKVAALLEALAEMGADAPPMMGGGRRRRRGRGWGRMP